jgi:uncharacterized membrane protein YhfC
MPDTAGTVSSLSVVFLYITVIVCFGVPIGISIWAKLRYRKSFSFVPLAGGAIGFLTAQVALSVLSQYEKLWHLASVPWLSVVLVAILFLLVEEFIRFGVIALLKDRRNPTDGMSFGMGHGGMQAILSVGLTTIFYLLYAANINGGTWNGIIASMPADQQSMFIDSGQQLIAALPSDFLLGGIDALSWIAIQIALSMLLFKGFLINKKWLYLLKVILAHLVINLFVMLTSLQTLSLNKWVIEAVVFALAVVATIYIIKQAKSWQKPSVPEGAHNEKPRQEDTP